MKRKRASYHDICRRGWVRSKTGQIIRFLSYTDYSPCEYGLPEREFTYRLPLNDPRPRGLHYKGSEHCADRYAELPIGVWIEEKYTDEGLFWFLRLPRGMQLFVDGLVFAAALENTQRSRNTLKNIVPGWDFTPDVVDVRRQLWEQGLAKPKALLTYQEAA